ncbi:MAG: hypothetical protein ABSE56_22135 [Bryobacteraceae bacterium]|jgi:hypothetical protein
MQMNPSEPKREWLRHALATLAYRAAKTLRGAPGGFAEFHVSETSRTPAQILAHMGDLLDWALSLSQGSERWHDSEPLPWEEEVRRFHAALEALDAYLGSGLPLESPAERLFQGPIADALTHVGQIAMLRRLAGAPIRAENYFRAKIDVGLLGPDQPAPVREFE